MKSLLKPALAASIAFASLAAPLAVAPANAQVNGIATARPQVVIASSKARDAAYQQINQSYSAQLTMMQQLNTEIGQLETSLDTNSDQQISEEEVAAKPSVVQQLQQKQQQVDQATQPIIVAQLYVIEQLMADYGNARSQVISDKGIALMLAPEAIQYAPNTVDVTEDLIKAVDSRLPSVSTAVPAGWQPTRRDTMTMHQSVQQVLMMAVQAAVAQQQAAQAQGAAAQQPSGR